MYGTISSAGEVTSTMTLSTVHLHKRASTSSKASKLPTCTSKTQKHCRHVKDNSVSLTVGLAVGIPIAVIFVVLACILFVVYRRNKKEAADDHDPEFEGDVSYLPEISSLSHSGDSTDLRDKEPGSDENDDHDGRIGYDSHEKLAYPMRPPLNPFAGSTSSRISSSSKIRSASMDPFQLPENIESNSLRNFALAVTGPEYGGYHVASMSKNGSDLSLAGMNRQSSSSRTNINSIVTPASTSFSTPLKEDRKSTIINMLQGKDDRSYHDTSFTNTNPSPIQQSPVKSIAGEVSKVYPEDEEANTSGYDIEHSRAESVEDAVSPDHGQPIQEEVSDDEGEKFYNTGLTSQEEANIARMKSLYRVYLDRNETMKTVKQNEANTLPQIEVEHVTLQQQRNPDEETSLVEQKSLPSLNETSHTRIASSIYSEIPTLPKQRQPMYEQTQYITTPIQEEHQLLHPQNLETIGELPTPAKLAYSPSTHSLTSFKASQKQPHLHKLQVASLNGTALNPVDHPEMFYTQNGYTHSEPSSAKDAAPLPFQLRQSVVMINPTEIQAPSTYKPAGSFRNVSANSRNNSLVSQGNPFHATSRVSGLLEERDTAPILDTPTVLPRSGTNDDLRNQLGGVSSHHRL